MASLPVIDFSCVTSEKVSSKSAEFEKLAVQLIDAFTTVGFAYITNHGVPQREVRNSMRLSEKNVLLSFNPQNSVRYSSSNDTLFTRFKRFCNWNAKIYGTHTI